MTYTDLIGMAAGVLTTVAYLPQLIRMWKSKSTRDISLLTFTTLSTGILLWAIYGVLIGSAPVIAANSVSLLLISNILLLKIKYK